MRRSSSSAWSGFGSRFGSFGRSIATPRSPAVPLLAGAEAKERPQRDQAAVAGLRREGHVGVDRPCNVRLKRAEQVAVDAGEDFDPGFGGELLEAGQIGGVGADGVRAAAAVEGLPVEVLLDGLGEGEGVASAGSHAPVMVLRIMVISRSKS